MLYKEKAADEITQWAAWAGVGQASLSGTVNHQFPPIICRKKNEARLIRRFWKRVLKEKKLVLHRQVPTNTHTHTPHCFLNKGPTVLGRVVQQ